MKIYTRTGDKGETSLFGGKRVGKENIRIEAYGTVDELNSVIGMCRSVKPAPEVDRILETVQNDLFALGADLATPISSKSRSIKRVKPPAVSQLERHIDSIDATLPPLKNFILPCGSVAAAKLHYARTVCRRAERIVVQLSRQEQIGTTPAIYLNRLSDLLFVLARKVNALEKIPETKWTR
jgi:cob(I)alamin adenosyltransferase